MRWPRPLPPCLFRSSPVMVVGRIPHEGQGGRSPSFLPFLAPLLASPFSVSSLFLSSTHLPSLPPSLLPSFLFLCFLPPSVCISPHCHPGSKFSHQQLVKAHLPCLHSSGEGSHSWAWGGLESPSATAEPSWGRGAKIVLTGALGGRPEGQGWRRWAKSSFPSFSSPFSLGVTSLFKEGKWGGGI